MLGLIKVAVTGGLSCGKSSVCRFFKELGSWVISADEIAHHLLSVDTEMGQRAVDLLGNDIVVKGKIERNVVANKVFNNHVLLSSLEKLLHPAILDEIENQYQQANVEQAPLFVAEIPLLFEIDRQGYFDLIINVWSDPETCQKRFMAATGHDADEYKKRMARQLPPEEKARRADININNTGDLRNLRRAVVDIFTQLTLKT